MSQVFWECIIAIGCILFLEISVRTPIVSEATETWLHRGLRRAVRSLVYSGYNQISRLQTINEQLEEWDEVIAYNSLRVCPVSSIPQVAHRYYTR